MNKIQEQLAAIHARVDADADIDTHRDAIAAATAAFTDLAGDIFGRDGAEATGAQKSLLRAVLAGEPLAGCRSDDLNAIISHFGAARLSGPFAGRKG